MSTHDHPHRDPRPRDHRRHVVVAAFATADGVVDDPDGSWGSPTGGWARRHAPQLFAGDTFRLVPVLRAGALLLGRSTWELMAQRWPGRTGELADVMNGAPKYVASRTVSSVEGWDGSVVLHDGLAPAVERLRAERDVVVIGSTGIVHQLAACGLVDEYRVLVLPTVVGGGERLFDGTPADLALASADVVGPGVLLRYTVRTGTSGPDVDGAPAAAVTTR
jgi:dihydrofolate reductase